MTNLSITAFQWLGLACAVLYVGGCLAIISWLGYQVVRDRRDQRRA